MTTTKPEPTSNSEDVMDVPYDLLHNLSDRLEDVQESLAPLLENTIQELSAKLPVIDKARLYVLAAYTLESLMFAYLKHQGVEAKSHGVRKELTRVKYYLQKIRTTTAQPGPSQTVNEQALAGVVEGVPLKLDVGAAGRFIRAALAGNDALDQAGPRSDHAGSAPEARATDSESASVPERGGVLVTDKGNQMTSIRSIGRNGDGSGERKALGKKRKHSDSKKREKKELKRAKKAARKTSQTTSAVVEGEN